MWVQQRQVCEGLGNEKALEVLSRSNMIRPMFLERLPCLNIPKYSDPPRGIRLRGTVQTGVLAGIQGKGDEGLGDSA